MSQLSFASLFSTPLAKNCHSDDKKAAKCTGIRHRKAESGRNIHLDLVRSLLSRYESSEDENDADDCGHIRIPAPGGFERHVCYL